MIEAGAPSRRSADVVVVGAGLAGLSAADRVGAAGREVIVLEARRDRVGGRLETDSSAGIALDVGGAWVGADHARVATLANELGLSTWPSHSDGHPVIVDEGRVATRKRPLVALDQRLARRRFEELADDIDPVAPWAAERAAELDGETLASWLRRSTRSPRARVSLGGTFANILAADAASVSLLHALFYVRSNGGLRALLSYADGAQQDLVAEGAQSLALGLAKRLGDAVVLGVPVRTIVQQGNTAVRVEAAGLSVDARAAIVALPPALAARIDFAPPLDSARDQLMQRTPQGDVIKVAVAYEQAFWRRVGRNGEAWGDALPFSFSHDIGPPAGAPGALAIFYVGERARALRRLPPGRRRELTVEALRRCFGGGATTPIAYIERDWAGEEWSRGAYCAFMPPGVWTAYGETLRPPAGRVVWAGAETAIWHNGYMEGALESAERAAAEALSLV